MDDLELFDKYLHGRCPVAYKLFGAHKQTIDGKDGYTFTLYSPMAKEVYIIGDFNNWEANEKSKMVKIDDRGLYKIFVENAKEGQRYKYHLLGCDNFWKDKQDPYAFSNGIGHETYSEIADIDKIKIDDLQFVKNRDRNFKKPMSIYEMHMGSWKRKQDMSFYTYSELADLLVPYLKDMGYTHVELLPITSYPSDQSWGYQATGYFSIDKRWGGLEDFASFMEKMHNANIGVIFDFVPVHFALDSFALERYDGSTVFEYGNDNEFSQWGTKNFDLGKDPVRSFLISSLFYFANIFHVDGFRFDAVSNIIYYGGDASRGVNYGAVEFIRLATRYVHKLLPGVMMIAEDSSAYGFVTKGLVKKGLCFDYKWDLGWMNDTLKYYQKDPIYKKYCHNQITFSMAYFYSENFLLPLSHDEVVHMKGSILNKMGMDWNGCKYDDKFALVRNLYAYQFAHPGKKLNFMGNELGTFNEWKEFEPIDFANLQRDNQTRPRGVQALIKDLNKIYKEHPCMYDDEYNPMKFSWIMADNGDQSIYIFYRQSKEECMVYIFNMTPNYYGVYDVGVPYEGEYTEILNTDNLKYAGWDQVNSGTLLTHGSGGAQNQKYKVTIKIPALAGIYLYHKIENK